MQNNYTWKPIYMELAGKLLEYKNRRQELCDWIYSSLAEYSGYLKNEDGSKLSSIDPFSVMAIFNRGSSWDTRTKIISKFKEKFSLINEVPTDFNGIPVVDNRKSFFYSWKQGEDYIKDELWTMFEKVVKGDDDIGDLYDKIIFRGHINNMLSMSLYWICPDRYLSIDGTNRQYLSAFIDIAEKPTFEEYQKIISSVKELMLQRKLPDRDFAELSYNAWEQSERFQNMRMWIWDSQYAHDYWEDYIQSSIVSLIDDRENSIDIFRDETEYCEKYKKEHGFDKKTSYPKSLCQFVNDVKVGDIFVIRYKLEEVLAWGVITSDAYWDDIQPKYKIVRKIEWKRIDKIKYEFPKQQIWFKEAKPEQYVKLINLLGIDSKAKTQSYNTNLTMTIDRKLIDIKQILDNTGQIILQGAPGTGKTYVTKSLAVYICDGMVPGTRAELNARYKELINECRVAFTTFHQSMDYEEFVEGLKPDSESSNGGFIIEDGIFKGICDKANNAGYSYNQVELAPDAVVWKVSLLGTGDNPVRSECMDNNHIRIGWDSYGSDLNVETRYDNGGKSILDTFINKMKIGDIVFSCYTNATIDAIGVIEGDYYYDENFQDYRRVRKVNWLVKGIKENIVAINGGKNMVQGTVYRLWNVKHQDIFNILQKYNASTNAVATSHEKKPYVLIIDEINRANISKVLGELITLLEKSKRLGNDDEVTVTLPYSKKQFGVPDNLYIIGTMNTADRSLGYIDYAIRRRFAFYTLTSDAAVIESFYSTNQSMSKMVLNKYKEVSDIVAENISNEFEVADLNIGHSYFLAKDEATFNMRMKYEVVPLLLEYLRDGILLDKEGLKEKIKELA